MRFRSISKRCGKQPTTHRLVGEWGQIWGMGEWGQIFIINSGAYCLPQGSFPKTPYPQKQEWPTRFLG